MFPSNCYRDWKAQQRSTSRIGEKEIPNPLESSVMSVRVTLWIVVSFSGLKEQIHEVTQIKHETRYPANRLLRQSCTKAVPSLPTTVLRQSAPAAIAWYRSDRIAREVLSRR